MPSAKQIAWRKKFAKMAKAGKFRKKKTRDPRSVAEIQGATKKKWKNTTYYETMIRERPLYVKRFLAKYNAEFRKMSDASKKSFMRDHPRFAVRVLMNHKA